MTDREPILCVDFDGVIHGYQSGWKGATVIPDEPVEGAMNALYQLTLEFDVQIYSSRSSQLGGAEAMQAWMRIHARIALGPTLGEILLERVKFPRDKPPAFLTIDDRAIRFDGNWRELTPERLLAFKTWQQGG